MQAAPFQVRIGLFDSSGGPTAAARSGMLAVQQLESARRRTQMERTGTRHDEVNLTVPANPDYLRLARVTAAGLASRIGFSFDQVEDLRLAIDELCFSLTGSEGRSGTVTMKFISREDRLEVDGTGHFEDEDRPVAISELSQLILDALLDEHSISGTDRSPTFHLVKLRGPRTP